MRQKTSHNYPQSRHSGLVPSMKDNSGKKNIKLVIAYDGSHYLGWQMTKMGASIEHALTKVLEKILQEPVTLQAASRTDAGVHARGQIVNFFTAKAIDPYRLRVTLNQLLPNDIAVYKVEEASATFHPTIDSSGKEYRYSVCNDFFQFPEYRNFSWHYPYTLNIADMHQAAQHFIGTHDFSSFCNVKPDDNYDNTIREVFQIEILKGDDNRILFKIRGNHFLYKMVRNIVGTILMVGRGKINSADIPTILQGLDRTQAGITAPAHGLTLYKVEY